MNPDRLIEAEDGTVVSIGRYTATARATGEALAVPFVHTWEFRDGRIAATTQYTDTWLVRTAMGAGSPSGAVG